MKRIDLAGHDWKGFEHGKVKQWRAAGEGDSRIENVVQSVEYREACWAYRKLVQFQFNFDEHSSLDLWARRIYWQNLAQNS